MSIADLPPTIERLLEEARAEIARLKAREQALLETNNRDLERRRAAEREVIIREIQIQALTRWLHLLLGGCAEDGANG